ncbi:MAG: TAXI family TRAP transporter solute-binding subunit [Gammaproteobacteria bacterium]|nr:TAXI family TRAP transporter solute-binding subunit [Gammaproteobacteria bacterium]MDH3858009.1 TAXI family TRAP transporter solute-binding subunit [Gammaproteobacteria bacterium]
MRALPVSMGLVLFVISTIFPTQADDLQFFRIGTGGVGGTYYPIGGIIASAVSNPPGSRPCNQGGSCGPPGLVVIAQSANGSVANVMDMQHGHLESGFVQSDIAYWAYTGSGTFEGEKPFRMLRAIANLYPESIHVVTRKDSGIRSIRDLAGKRVSLDEPGSGTLIDAELVLSIYGISKKDIRVEYMKPGLAVKRIRDNKLDAFFIVAGYPSRAVAELAKDTTITLIPIDGAEADQLVSQYRFFSRADIPAGVYSGVPRVETVSVGAQWLVAATMEDETIYQITKTLWNQNSRKLLDGGHAKGRYITLETAMDGITVPLHPGARRFYDEIGILVE